MNARHVLEYLTYENDTYHTYISQQLTKTTLTKLITWKNKAPLSRNQKIMLDRAIKALRVFDDFRHKRITKEQCLVVIEDVTASYVWQLFLLHVCRPLEIPLTDSNTIRAFLYVTQYKIIHDIRVKDIRKHEKAYFEYIRRHGVPGFDRAMMRLGEALKKK